ncbi:hypothetical protein [Dyadobacter aurulentus]|uniref:hypothetical protein n=1 Tax=Dyadobacter sp. UC 10 TaxID=2605428 RepID=UPI001788A81E|nr:hypothetical protein [Dyadobacter sp. UC 10]
MFQVTKVFTMPVLSQESLKLASCRKTLALQRTKKQLADALISNEEGFIKSLSR